MLKPVQPSSYTFRTLIEGGYLYVDKTPYLYQLIREAAGIYFLARPRRFGKSLMLSTLEEIFQGNRELFRGLWLYESDYNWQAYPIIRIDFSLERVYTAKELQEMIGVLLEEIAAQHNITLSAAPYQRQFRRLIQQVAAQEKLLGKVVILIDEYDKPIIDNIENLAEAQQIREVLKNFYAVIKAMDAHLRFVFITGISKFSRVGIFSAMNNLNDITAHPQFAAALGITEPELLANFADRMTGVAAQMAVSPNHLLEKLRHWYNGFRFTAEGENVYNPYSTLLFFNHQRFSNFWFESGTPTFLIKLLKQQDYDVQQLDDLRLRELAFSTYEIENLAIVPLLFQTGYLTIKGYQAENSVYTLAYPNAEVRDAFLTYLLSAFNGTERAFNDNYLVQLVDALQANDLDTFFRVLVVFFANLPYDLQIKQEKYYQTIFYLIFKLIGVQVAAEVRTNQGRIDAVVEVSKHIFLFEFKLDGGAEEALQQIKEHEYAQQYGLKHKAVTLIGVNFDSAKRTVTDWKKEVVQATGS